MKQKRCSECGKFIGKKDFQEDKVTFTIEANPVFTHRSCVKEPEECTHEFVSREYLSQPYGTCMSCGKTIFG